MVYVYEMKNSVIVKKRAQVVLGEGGHQILHSTSKWFLVGELGEG